MTAGDIHDALLDLGSRHGETCLAVGLVWFLVAGFQRRLWALSGLLLYATAFPDYSWPTWWCCLTPLVWLWRTDSAAVTTRRAAWEAGIIGCAMCWLNTSFVRVALPTYGALIHAAACLTFSLQIIALALVIRAMRNRPITLAALCCASLSLSGEWLDSRLGVAWPVTSLSLTVADTPLAQWSRWIGPYGVSGGLSFVNCLWCPEHSANAYRRWLGPTVGLICLPTAWLGGSRIADGIPITTPSCSILLVQPHLRHDPRHPAPSWPTLDRLTRAALAADDAVDLVVWPETCLSGSWRDGDPSGVEHNDLSRRLTLQDYARHLAPRYGVNSLVGVVVSETGTTRRYGLEVAEVRRYNCGCLISPRGEFQCHEKQALVPLRESLPWWLESSPWRDQVVSRLGLPPPFSRGRAGGSLRFEDRQGGARTLSVSVCYESFFPGLPQYERTEDLAAIVHLVYDGLFAEHPEVIQRQVRACQYRAIETRRWNLVCSTWSGSALIDPAGRIVASLPAASGVLRWTGTPSARQ